MTRRRTCLSDIVLGLHMPVLLTVFFWALLYVECRTSGACLQSCTVLAWLLAMECWFVAAGWKKRQLIGSTSYLLCFWLFQSLIVTLALHSLNRVVKLVSEETLQIFDECFFWLLLPVLIVVRNRLLAGRQVRSKSLAFWFCLLLIWPVFVASGAYGFVRQVLFEAAVITQNRGNMIVRFETPTQPVIFAAESTTGDALIRMYALDVPSIRTPSPDVEVDFTDATGAAITAERNRTWTALCWIKVDEFRLADDYTPPLTVHYNESPHREPADPKQTTFTKSFPIARFQ